MKDRMSVSSFNSLNSAIMYNMEIIIKMSIAVIVIIVFNFFQMPL